MMKKLKTSAILLAGGTGSRVQSATPKQFLLLNQKIVALYSFELFLSIPEIDEVIIICSPCFRTLFETDSLKPVLFALPGIRRQDSLYNGLQIASHELICVHDAARPIIDKEIILKVLENGKEYGAATAGMPLKFTIKESNSENFACKTPDRNKFWEIQTPQVLHRDILNKGFEYVNKNNMTITDDTSLAELIGKPVKLVEGSHTNLKITMPSDLLIAGQLLQAKKNE